MSPNMKRFEIVGLTLSLSLIAPASRAAQLTLNFDAFIPTPRIANPVANELPPFFTEFIGDDRDFDLVATQNGEARLFTEVVLDTDAPDPLVSSSTGGGTTVGFLIQDGVEVAQSAQAPTASSVTATRLSDNQILLEVAASATNPLIENFLPSDISVPPAEYVYDITLTQQADGLAYDLVGTNREYPSYSVFLNEVPILLNTANGDDSTLLSNVESVSTSGVLLNPEAAAVAEPATLLGIGLVAAVIIQRKRIR